MILKAIKLQPIHAKRRKIELSLRGANMQFAPVGCPFFKFSGWQPTVRKSLTVTPTRPAHPRFIPPSPVCVFFHIHRVLVHQLPEKRCVPFWFCNNHRPVGPDREMEYVEDKEDSHCRLFSIQSSYVVFSGILHLDSIFMCQNFSSGVGSDDSLRRRSDSILVSFGWIIPKQSD